MNKYITLSSLLKKKFYQHTILLIVIFFGLAIIIFFSILALERKQICSKLENRLNDLNDVLAREIILNSADTLNFEINKIKSDFSLQHLTFKPGYSTNNPKTCSTFNLSNRLNYPIKFGDQVLGNFEARIKTLNIFSIQNALYLLPLLSIILLSFLFTKKLQNLIVNTFITPFSAILAQSHEAQNTDFSFSYLGSITEFKTLVDQLNIILFKLNQINEVNFQLEKTASIGEIATQVAHDIRSPLASLSMLSRDITAIPEDERLLLRSSINRIEDIANSLLKRHRETKASFNKENIIEPYIISLLIEEIISEKRIKYRNMIGIEIDFLPSRASFGLSANINSVDFKRVISNLIDNSVESIKTNGKVSVFLTPDDEHIQILINDNGCGIPVHVLNKLGTEKITSRKENGNGFGVYHSVKLLKSWGGDLIFQSNETDGTKTIIKLKASPTPDWFISSIRIKPSTQIVILDDDSSIHKIWEARFSDKTIPQNLKHFTTSESLKEFHNSVINKEVVYLIDYEILGSNLNGLDVIEQLGIQDYSILVTSRYDQANIVDRASKINLKILPKSMAEFIPIETNI